MLPCCRIVLHRSAVQWQAFTVGQELGCVVDAVCSGSGVAGNAAGGAAELVAELAGGP